MWDQRIADRITSYSDILYYAEKRAPKSIFHAFRASVQYGRDIDQNVEALREIQVRPHEMLFTTVRDMSTTVVGHKIELPVILSSVGGLRGAHRDGEVAVTHAAGEFGTIQYVSGMTTTPIEEIVAAATGPVFQQVYYIGSRELARENIKRAINAGVSGLVLIADWLSFPEPPSWTPKQRGYLPTQVTFKDAVKFAPQLVTRPAWALDFLLNGLNAPTANYSVGPDGKPLPYYFASAILDRETPTWDDVAWIRDMWKGPLILKGILRADDALRAVEVGADGVVVSNHCTAQPGRRFPTIRALPDVVEAVGSKIDVLFDGGVRGGLDVVKALAMGAKAVGIGQMEVDALMAAGEPGVMKMMGMLKDQVVSGLRQVGAATLDDIDQSTLTVPGYWADAMTVSDLREAVGQRHAGVS